MVTLSRPGQDLGAGDGNTNFLKVFSGEVLAMFQETNRFLPITMNRTISSGKSAAFPVIGSASAQWHTPGESVITDQAAAGSQGSPDPAATDYLSGIKATEKEIFIDDCLVSSVLVDDLDRMKAAWDARSEYSSAIGRALSKAADEHILSSIYAASQASANITGVTAAGATVTKTGSDTSGANLVAAAFTAAETLDGNDVPAEDRYMAVDPTRYYLLAQETSLVNRDFGGTNGIYADGSVLKVAGFTIVETNNMGSGDLTGTEDTGAKNDPHGGGISEGYNADWSNMTGLCFHRSCAGTVKMADLQVLSEFQTERLAWLLLAKYAMGHSYLRPEAAVAIKSA